MKKIKFTLIAILLIYPLYWCYDNLICFEYDRILVYQGQKEDPFIREEPYTTFHGYDSLCDEFPDFKDKAEAELGFDPGTLDMSKYQYIYMVEILRRIRLFVIIKIGFYISHTKKVFPKLQLMYT